MAEYINNTEYIDRKELVNNINNIVKLTNKDEQEWVKDECIRQAYCIQKADVVPRSEVEAMQKRIANQREEIERLRKHTHNLQQSRNHYKAKAEGVGKQLHNVLQNYHEKIIEAKQEVAREIFEEIKHCLETYHIRQHWEGEKCVEGYFEEDLEQSILFVEEKYIGE